MVEEVIMYRKMKELLAFIVLNFYISHFKIILFLIQLKSTLENALHIN